MDLGKFVIGPVQNEKGKLREVKEFLSILEGIPIREP